MRNADCGMKDWLPLAGCTFSDCGMDKGKIVQRPYCRLPGKNRSEVRGSRNEKKTDAGNGRLMADS